MPTAKVPNVPFQMLDSMELSDDEWKAIADTARWQMTRMNLNTFARHNVFDDKQLTKKITQRLRDADNVRGARAFPYQLLQAHKNVDTNVPKGVVAALEDAMEIAVDNRDRDTEKFNSAFGTSYLTYNRIRNILRKGAFPASDKLYASTYIGHGMRIGPLWDRTTGFGRWHFILRRKFRLPKGARVLSLGSNNASIELHLLREGAEEVIAYERDDDYAAQGRFLATACEWADKCLSWAASTIC